MENLPPQLRAIAHTINPKVLAEIIRMETAKKSSASGASPTAGGEAVPGQQPQPPPAKRDAETVTDEVGTSAAKVFENYQSRLDFGCEHPGNIAESGLLSSTALPPLTYPADGLQGFGGGIVETGKLSKLQLEGVLYAGQHHQLLLGDGRRAGFFIGDGAGVGKGRQIAGVIVDNCARGRLKHVWFSTSTDLYLDAQRDLTDLGCHVPVIDGCKALSVGASKGLGASKSTQRGVLFSTYSTLVSGGGSGNSSSSGGSGSGSGSSSGRLAQIVAWCGGAAFEGCIVFDEAHKAKNFVADKTTGQLDDKASSKVAAAVVALQRQLPLARVLYASATGVSDISNLVYADRLGLWGAGSPFRDFSAFDAFVAKRGLGGLEMLAMEMKSSGMYVARGLSWQGAEFSTDVALLDTAFRAIYDAAVAFMVELRGALEEACQRTKSKKAKRSYWGLHVRFFKELCVAAKVARVVEMSTAALQSGMAVVIGLQTTGEAGMERVLLKGSSSHQDLQRFVSTAQQSLLHFIEHNFPTIVEPSKSNANSHASLLDQDLMLGVKFPEDYQASPSSAQALPTPAATSSTSCSPFAAGKAVGVEDEYCAKLKVQMLAKAEALNLPPAPLDLLMDQLGGPNNVAEMTGRRGRVVRKSKGNKGGHGYMYELRASAAASVDMDTLNVAEKKKFMGGLKDVAIISDAASTGISLHAARSVANQKRRVHITVELPWSAEKAIQQLGRTHRSNQAHAPSYRLVVTDLGGEKRFASSVARRLMQLGALTRGDRRAAIGGDWDDVNHVESKYGKRALDGLILAGRAAQRVMNDESGYEGTLGCSNAVIDRATGAVSSDYQLMARALNDLGLDNPGDDSKLKVKTFLNRLLGLRVESQNAIFDLFQQRLADCVSTAKETGQFDEGVSNLRGQSFQLKSSEALSTDQVMGATTVLHDIVSDRGVSWKQALALCCDALTKKEKRLAAAAATAAAAAASESAKPVGEATVSANGPSKTGDGADAMENDDNLVDSDSEDSGEDESDEDDDGVVDIQSGVVLGSNKPRDFGFFESKGSSFGRGITFLWAKQKNAPLWVVTRPNSGRSQYEMETEKLHAAYRRVPMSLEEAKAELAKAELEEKAATSNTSAAADGGEGAVSMEEISKEVNTEKKAAGEAVGGEAGDAAAVATVDEGSNNGDEIAIVGKEENPALARLRKGWCTTYAAALAPNYKHGQRICKVALLGGAILPVWAVTEQVVAQHGRDLALAERALRVVRVTTDCGKSLAGVKFPANLVPFLKEAIRSAAAAKASESHATAAALTQHASSITATTAVGSTGAPKNGYVVQPPTPIDPKALKFASTPAPTIMSFFGKPAPPKLAEASSTTEAATAPAPALSLSSPAASTALHKEGRTSGNKRAASEIASVVAANAGTASPRKKKQQQQQQQQNKLTSMFKPTVNTSTAPLEKPSASGDSVAPMPINPAGAQDAVETIDLT